MKHLKPMVLDPGHLNNARRLFQTEAIALEKLGHHPQIPRLLAYFEENNDFYLVQDLIRGYPLTKELKTGFQWLEADIYQLLYDVLSILIFVHDRGVIHRDIKPDNIIRRQIDRTLVLVDFGSVKQIRTHLHPNHETGQTISIGTIGYMSTEQAHGRPRPNSDLYSLGIIGIQAATGIKPKNFQEDGDTGELVWRHQANISDGLACFLEKMVSYHFKDRYLDARAALRALKQIQPHGSPRYGLRSDEPLLDKPSYWSLTASRLASAITSLRPALQNTPLSQPTFIELPEPTEVSDDVVEEEPLDRLEEVNQTMPMAYVKPLISPGSETTTADLDINDLNEVMGPGSQDGQEADVDDELRQGEVLAAQSEQAGCDTPLVVSELPPQQRLDEGAVDAVEAHDVAVNGALPSLARVDTNTGVLVPTAIVFPQFLTRLSRLFSIGGGRSPGWSMNQENGQQVRTGFVVFGGLGAIALALWGGHVGFQRLQDFRQIQAALQLMQDQKSQGLYSDCQQQAQQLQGKSEAVDSLGYECVFQGAEQHLGAREWDQAIASANAIPPEAGSYYEAAQESIRKSYILALDDAVQEGNLTRTIEIADAIDEKYPNHPLQAEVQLTRLKWEAEERLWLDGLELLEQGKWQEASERVQPLEASPYFRDRAKALRKEADLNLQQTTVEGEAETTITRSPLLSAPVLPPPGTKNKPKF